MLTYEEFILEGFDIGNTIETNDGQKGIIISKDTHNGTVTFRDSNGKIFKKNPITCKLEEDLRTEPEMIGTGISTPVTADSNPTIKGYTEPFDSAGSVNLPQY